MIASNEELQSTNEELHSVNEELYTVNAEQIRTKGALITSDPLPTLFVDEAQIETVFTNLLQNAMQYCDEIPKIQIQSARDQNEWLIQFSDNGLGIAQKHQERIFTVFQRLGFKEEVDGDCMGLAMARRIIDMGAR